MLISPEPAAQQAEALFREAYGPFPTIFQLDKVPGRVNLIGEHIDYHLLPVLPIAIDRHIAIAYRPNGKREVCSISSAAGSRITLALGQQTPAAAGDWSNYVGAAIDAACLHWPVEQGLDAAISSDLPIAAGLSSSSALMIAHLLALLRVNGISLSMPESISELMKILPEAEQFVGTRGGGMDHAAIIASQAGSALHVQFQPFQLAQVVLPPSWRLLVAHSLTHAEKSGAVRERYNSVKQAGLDGLRALSFSSFHEAVAADFSPTDSAYPAFRHVVEEARRVSAAITAITENALADFGQILLASHGSLRDNLRISTPAIDRLVEEAVNAGAAGARMTGAGFGGCVLVACHASIAQKVYETLDQRYYAKQAGFDPAQHLFFVEPSRGALIDA